MHSKTTGKVFDRGVRARGEGIKHRLSAWEPSIAAVQSLSEGTVRGYATTK